MKKIFLVLALAANCVPLYAQQTLQLVHRRLQMVAQGEISSVREELPRLKAKYPDDAGIKLLEAVTMDDADEAFHIYRSIVRNTPQNEWAAYAQWRIIQYYAIQKAMEQAREELEYLREHYPNSEYLIPAGDMLRAADTGSKKISPQQTGNVRVISSDPKKISSEEKISHDNVRVNSSDGDPTSLAERRKNSSEEDTGRRFGLQVAVFSTRERAESERKKYSIFKSSIIEKKVGQNTMYALIIGDYKSDTAAEKDRPKVENKCDCKPILIEK